MSGHIQVIPFGLRLAVPKPPETIYYFKGRIRKMVAYNRALTQTEIEAVVAAMKE
jgi:hypothetical protein